MNALAAQARILSCRWLRSSHRAIRSLTDHWPLITALKSLAHQFFHSQRTLRRFVGHHLLDILCNQIRFEIDGIARLQRFEVSHLDSMRNDGKSAVLALEFCNSQTDAFDRNRTLVYGVFLHVAR